MYIYIFLSLFTEPLSDSDYMAWNYGMTVISGLERMTKEAFVIS
jgi:hypothetical protein